MQKLIAELFRLYLMPDALPPELLAQHVQGTATLPIRLASEQGLARAAMIAFARLPGDGEAQHWERLCEAANALQTRLGLPAPAVSISGDGVFGLWLSFSAPLPLAQLASFLEQLRDACFQGGALPADAAAPVLLPPCLHPGTGHWAAFIHPGMGASFADADGLEMAPPLAGQAGFLDQLRSISPEQMAHALQLLAPPAPAAPPAEQAAAGQPASLTAHAAGAAGSPPGLPEGLLLKDATLEDIVRFLHAKNIEPTFRHLLPDGR